METPNYENLLKPDTELIEIINKRALNSSEKIKTWVKDFSLEGLGIKAKDHLERMKSDYGEIIENPNDSNWGGSYKNFTTEEIKELYFVSYGEDLEDEK